MNTLKRSPEIDSHLRMFFFCNLVGCEKKIALMRLCTLGAVFGEKRSPGQTVHGDRSVLVLSKKGEKRENKRDKKKEKEGNVATQRVSKHTPLRERVRKSEKAGCRQSN